ncbi:MAG: alpha/beta hydrolase [Planctomycetota bacterium]
MVLPKTNYIHLANGKFDSTSLEDLDLAFESFHNSQPVSGWVIHFHGGLVSESSARETAAKLLPAYQEADAFPFFFIWESGIFETVFNNLRDIAREPLFRKLAGYLVEYLLGKLGKNAAESFGAEATGVSPHLQVEQWLGQETEAFAAGLTAPPFNTINAQDFTHDISDATCEANEIEALLSADPQVEGILKDLNTELIAARSGTEATSKEGTTYQIPGHLSSRGLKELSGIDETSETNAEGAEFFLGITLGSVALAAARIGIRVIKRYLTSRDHGLYTTVVEEILRDLYVDDIGSTLFWNQMKRDTSDAFGDDPEQHGGTAFLERLLKQVESGHIPRITLVGHSAGAIYVSNFLLAANRVLPAEVKFDVLLLAPAVEFKLFHQAIASERIGRFRMFGMDDERESKNALLESMVKYLSFLYPRSLLYFVSGLLEKTVDHPLLGMERYHTGEQYTGEHFPNVNMVRRYLDSVDKSRVWSPSVNQPEGLNSDASRHGDFDDNDPETLASLQHLIREGFAN